MDDTLLWIEGLIRAHPTWAIIAGVVLAIWGVSLATPTEIETDEVDLGGTVFECLVPLSQPAGQPDHPDLGSLIPPPPPGSRRETVSYWRGC